jgi:prepilin-type N-terminal cleavage/methylation domain-containing protein
MYNLKQSNDRGFTLIELTITLVLTGIMIFMAGVGMIIFFSKFSHLNMYADLQNDAFDMMHTFKHGMIIEGSDGEEFLGIMVADTLKPEDSTAPGEYRKLTCRYNGTETLHRNDYVTFYFDTVDGSVKARYKYGNDSPAVPVKLFPVEHSDEIEVTDLRFVQLDEEKRLWGVDLEAQIKDTGTSTNADWVRRVRFETKIKVR